MKTIKRLLIFVLILAVAFTIGYFVYTGVKV